MNVYKNFVRTNITLHTLRELFEYQYRNMEIQPGNTDKIMYQFSEILYFTYCSFLNFRVINFVRIEYLRLVNFSILECFKCHYIMIKKVLTSYNLNYYHKEVVNLLNLIIITSIIQN